ncbi:MAG: glycosyltransferase [Gemmatimonadota bacterium]|nr:glycosyltransferase [Gemmatimonadota bacterium]
MKLVEPDVHLSLDDYAAVGRLAPAADALRATAETFVPRLEGRTVWHVNSTAQGGGVAELLPAQIKLMRDLGVDTRWLVMGTNRPEFFALTKRIHNMIHGAMQQEFTAGDRALYEEVSRANAEALLQYVRPDDVLLVHDPQPLGAGARVKRRHPDIRTIWRCHIGLEEDLPVTRAAWDFLRPYASVYDQAVFSVGEYVPKFLADRASVIHPSLDPLGHKNRELSLHKLVGILSDAGLTEPHWPLLAPPWPEGARRLQADGTWEPATTPEDIGLLARPIITQVSRWDKLKGFEPLMEAFRALKLGLVSRPAQDVRHRRRLELVRLVLAGPEPSSIQDDPEGLVVLNSLCKRYLAFEPDVREDVALLALPMGSRKANALMVNALQSSSDIVAQNSLREGFGLTVAEAMWKGKPVLGSARACGVRLQVRDRVNGVLVADPEDAEEIAEAMHRMLADEDQLEAWGSTAQRRVYDEFLIFEELRRWLELLADD